MLTQSSKAVQRFACRHRVARLRSSIAQAASPVICEALEGRRLLTTYFYEVPFGHSVAYIQQLTGGLPGQLQVRLDDPITGTIEPGGIFNNDEGMDIIDAGANAGFLFVDQVPAALKPISDGFDQGIQVQGGSNSRLRIEAADADTLIEVVDGSVPFVKVNDFTSVSRMGAGVSKLTIRTNNLQPMDFYPNGGTDVRVPALAGIALEVDTGSGTYDRIFLGNNDTIGEQVTVKTGAGNCIVDLQTGDGDDGTNALVDFTGGSLGLGNKLVVHSAGTATLKQLASPGHTIYVDEVTVTGAGFNQRGTLLVEDASTIGTLQVLNNATATLAAGSNVSTFTVGDGGVATITAASTIGTLIVDGSVTFTGTSGNSTVTAFQVSAMQVQNTTGVVEVGGGAHVTALTTSRMGTLWIPGTGTLTLQPHTSGQPRRVLTLKSLFMGNDPTQPSGTLDLTDNGMIVDYSLATPHDYIKSLITSAYAGGAWTGNGITSSTAAGMSDTGVGYAENDGSADGLSLASFLGESVDGTSVLARYTYYGDVNLDGLVNLPDFNRMTANFGQSNRLWVHGDSTYDGQVLLPDFNRLAANFGKTSLGPGEDDGGDGFGGGEPEYTYDDLLAILMQMYPEYF